MDILGVVSNVSTTHPSLSGCGSVDRSLVLNKVLQPSVLAIFTSNTALALGSSRQGKYFLAPACSP